MREAPTVSVGSRVLVRFQDGRTKKVQVASIDQQIAPQDGIISSSSPIGKALVGRRVGDKISYAVENRMFEAEIIDLCQ